MTGHRHINRLTMWPICAALLLLWLPLSSQAQEEAPPLSADIFKSFYRSEVTVRYRLNVPDDQLAQHRIVATVNTEGQTDAISLKEISPVAAEGAFSMSTEALPVGRYSIDLALRDANGGEVARTSLLFPQLADPTVTERLVTVRESDNMLIVEGKPHFPIGIYSVPIAQAHLDMLADAGFNLVMLHAYASPSLPSVLDKLRERDMRAWGIISSTLDFSTDADNKRERLGELVQLAGNHPGLLVWESIDEPAWGSRSAEGLYDGYCFMRELDQQHLIWTNHAPRNTIEELAYFNRATDIAGADIYPIPEPTSHTNLPNRTISSVGDETDKNQDAVNNEKPIFMVLQGFGWGELSEPNPDKPPVMPTFVQSRFMAYDAIAHGANGILYWGTHRTKKPSQFWSELRSLVSELSALQDVFAAETLAPDQGALLQQTAVDDEKGLLLLHKQVDGFNYLILVNESPEPKTTRVTLPTMRGDSLRRLYENTSVDIENGAVSVDLEGYGVAVLTDNADFADERRDYSDEWQNYVEAPPVDLSEPGNAIRNPGFEIDANGNGLPDAWEDIRAPMSAARSTDAHSGKYAFRIEGVGGDGMPLAVQRPLKFEAGKRYRFSGWMKTEPADVEVRFYTEWVIDGKFHGKILPWAKGTTEWAQHSFEFEATPDPGGGAYAVIQVRGEGIALFDDLKLELVE